MAEDTYRTVKTVSEGHYTEKRSRFLSFAIPVRTPAEAMEHVREYRKKYYDARHVCWAYMLGADRKTFRVSDDGEPSSTAGKPILGQINSRELTDILVIVVRYFGGIELGTGGLIVAYRTAAAAAIAAAETEERTVDETLTVVFEYPSLNSIMRIIKEEQPEIVSQTFEMTCEMTLRIRKTLFENLKTRLLKVETAYIPPADSCKIPKLPE
ncbi:MAG: IMPACT family protein [Tannerella sp.]|nr:IMPACT family protein [Tannerella sp.]